MFLHIVLVVIVGILVLLIVGHILVAMQDIRANIQLILQAVVLFIHRADIIKIVTIAH